MATGLLAEPRGARCCSSASWRKGASSAPLRRGSRGHRPRDALRLRERAGPQGAASRGARAEGRLHVDTTPGRASGGARVPGSRTVSRRPRAGGRLRHLLGFFSRRLSPPRLRVRKYECPSSCNADWHGQSDESLVLLRFVVLRSTGVLADAVPPGVLRPMCTATRNAAAGRDGRSDAARESSESALV